MSLEPTLSWYLALAPEIALAILLVAIQVYSRTLPLDQQRKVGLMTAWGAFIILLLTLGLWYFAGEPSNELNNNLGATLIWGGMIRHDLITLVFRVIFLAALTTTSLISLDVKRMQKVEYYALLIMATMGFSLMGASADLIMLYIGLEMASISSYVLAGFAKNEDRSPEAGMKYFVYGAFATGLMLYGMSLVYGLTGQTNLYVIGQMVLGVPAPIDVANNPTMVADIQNINAVLLIAAAMIIVGFGFKISAVPFHFWTPDVYEGSPTPFTAFVSTASKAAGFAVFMRVFTSGMLNFHPDRIGQQGQGSDWWFMLVSMCIITMTVGNFAAIYQRNIKRMLAYSSVAQAGYAMIGLVTLTPDGSGATMFYLLMYVFTNVAAFGVIIVISNVSKSEQMEDFYGLNKRSPYLALVMLFALLSLGGIPPTAGFLGKFFIFKAAVEAGYWWLALIGILNAFVALYYYLNVVKYMYLYDSEQEGVAIPVSRGAWVGLGLSTAAIIILGVYAGPAFEWTRQAATAFFALVGVSG